MDINTVFPSKYVRAADLHGRDVTVNISHVELGDVSGGEGEEMKPIVHFEGKQRGLVLNRTNANTIAGMYGPETDNWVGKSITLFATQTDFAGKAVPCIRVRLAPPAVIPATTTPAAITEDAIPF